MPFKKFQIRAKGLPAGRQGFTLVEVLITISLIGVIFGVILTSAVALQKKQNDSKRQADLKIIQAALQQYYADNNTYPASDYTLTAGAKLQNPMGNKTYLNNIPGDPFGSYYGYAGRLGDGNACNAIPCINYCLFAKLEGNPPGPNPLYCPQLPAYNYAVSLP